MTYIRCAWIHEHPDEPVMLYSELDDARFEVRKVEIFRNGRSGYASADDSGGGTELGTLAVPALGEIALDPQFAPSEITREEFESVWDRVTATIE